MVRKTKKNYFNKRNIRKITDNKQFWKTVRHFFSNKFGDNERITLIQEGKIVSEVKEVAEIFKSYFETLVENLVLTKVTNDLKRSKTT